MTRFYAFFHCNLLFSSIPEEQRAAVVRNCYWPMLRLADRPGIRIGIEAPASTLEFAAAADPTWLEALQEGLDRGRVELIGSGYVQAIGPLLPAAANRLNLAFGQRRYEQLLGRRPTVALINEQCFAAGLVPLYREAGFDALIMEWENARLAAPETHPHRWSAARVAAPDGSTMRVLWHQTLISQQMQRAAHGETSLDEFFASLARRRNDASADPIVALYGGDAEIFDFRPGRFVTEPERNARSEWDVLGDAFERALREPGAQFVHASELASQTPADAPIVATQSAAHPIATKKQFKYNVVRWAASGRNSLGINTRCARLSLAIGATPDDETARALCLAWASDARTHITLPRWQAHEEALAALEQRFAPALPVAPQIRGTGAAKRPTPEQRFVQVETDAISMTLNLRRGLSIERAAPRGDNESWCGTVAHGYFDDIAIGADWYTGNLVFRAPLKHQVTDLEPAEPVPVEDPAGQWTGFEARIDSPLGPIWKRVVARHDRPTIEITTRLDWAELPRGSLRLGHLTLDPRAFDAGKLAYATHNGGEQAERFLMNGVPFDHGAAVSHLVTATTALGATEGAFWFDDGTRRLTMRCDRNYAALVPMIAWHPTDHGYLCRAWWSAQELDDTAIERGPLPAAEVPLAFRFELAFGPAGT
ncbi:hypothetical protein [Roseiterribacter gracilis]|uniref:Glycoside hydrolase n=1 Tax=Roseiterribacter gracilis TaxID=2812848 RepID=A0A8S8XHL8_9PROT|nr:glycoside hydrolase [Rhodospirillales bacterium TMPK1]